MNAYPATMTTPPSAESEALSVEDAARRAGISRTFIYANISSGALPSVKIGRRRLVRIEALRHWLKSMEKAAA